MESRQNGLWHPDCLSRWFSKCCCRRQISNWLMMPLSDDARWVNGGWNHIFGTIEWGGCLVLGCWDDFNFREERMSSWCSFSIDDVFTPQGPPNRSVNIPTLFFKSWEENSNLYKTGKTCSIFPGRRNWNSTLLPACPAREKRHAMMTQYHSFRWEQW